MKTYRGNYAIFSTVFGLVFVGAALCTRVVHADTVVTITSGNVYAYAFQTPNPQHLITISAASLFNTPTSLTATTGSAISTVEYMFSNSGFIQEATHGLGTSASSTWGQSHSIQFTVSNDTTYMLSGNITATGLSQTRLYGNLYNVTDSTVLFENDQWSNNETNGSLTFGEMGGDAYNTLLGSLNGNLLVGKTYRFEALGQLANSQPSHFANSSSATSNISLLIVDHNQPVPTPTAALMGVSLFSAMIMRRQRSQA